MPARPGAGWAAIPVEPEAVQMTTQTLLSANPPPYATDLVPGGGVRPGNNARMYPGFESDPTYNLICKSG